MSTTSPLLLYARDVRSHHRLQPLVEASARISGLVTRVGGHGRVRFISLRDATGSIQLIAERGKLGDADWETVKAVRAGQRITAVGGIGLSRNGELSISLTEAPISRSNDLGASLSQGEDDYARVGSQILAARLRNRATAFFRRQGFVEIEPALISASWRSPGLEPLLVQYQGFGAPAYLAPSPASQLLDALVATGVNRVFAVSRCFTTTYRDEKSSAESSILVTKAFEMSMEEANELVREAVTEVLGDLETLPEEITPLLTDWTAKKKAWPPEPGSGEYGTPTIELYSDPVEQQGQDPTQIAEVSRVVWPPNRVIAETASEVLEGELDVVTCTLHLERMVSLLRDIPLRQLRHLGETAETSTEAVAQ